MFSKRIPSNLAPNALSRLKLELGGGPLIDLSLTNPSRVGLPMPWPQIHAALAAVDPRRYDPDPQGERSAREAVCAYYAEAHGAVVHPDDIFLTASTSEAYSFVFKLLADPGGTMLIPQPSYPLFEHLLALEGLLPSPYDLIYLDGWQIEWASLMEGLPGARGMITVSPNNPTGSSLSSDEWARLAPTLEKLQTPLVSDEVFLDYPLDALSPSPLGTLAGRDDGPLTFSLGGLSKLLGLPQLKLSWMVLSGEAHLKAQARRRLEVIADSYLSVATPIQRALPTLLQLRRGIGDAILGRTRVNHTALNQLTRQSPVTPLRAQGGWSAVIRIPRMFSADETCRRFAVDGGVWVQPGYFFDLPEGHAVLSLLGPIDDFEAGVKSIVDLAVGWCAT